MTDSNRRILHAALVAALISSPVFAASDPAAIEQQLNALQQALARQQEQLAQQQQEIERLRQQLADDVQQAKLAAQDVPRSSMTSGRPTISSADGRSSIALRFRAARCSSLRRRRRSWCSRLPSRLSRRSCQS